MTNFGDDTPRYWMILLSKPR